MRLHLHEQEVLIRRCADEDSWDIESSIPAATRQLEALAQQYGIVLTVTQHGVRGKFPRRCIAFRKPISEARRRQGRAIADRMRSTNATTLPRDTNE